MFILKMKVGVATASTPSQALSGWLCQNRGDYYSFRKMGAPIILIVNMLKLGCVKLKIVKCDARVCQTLFMFFNVEERVSIFGVP